jgi:hypothetical protein
MKGLKKTQKSVVASIFKQCKVKVKLEAEPECTLLYLRRAVDFAILTSLRSKAESLCIREKIGHIKL